MKVEICEGAYNVDDTFRSECLSAALKTMGLNPLDVLLSEDRIPRTVDLNEGRAARPPWVGKNYRPGGVLLMGKNPGGGSSSFEKRRPSWDFPFFDALKRLREKRDIAAYAHLSDKIQPTVMRQWPMWLSISAVLDALKLASSPWQWAISFHFGPKITKSLLKNLKRRGGLTPDR